MGAAIYGGRWNKKGAAVLYTGATKEIALLETIVHTPPMIVPDLDILTLEIPDDSITEIKIEDLPKNWIDYPAPSVLAQIGEDWVDKGETITLKVPSCIVSIRPTAYCPKSSAAVLLRYKFQYAEIYRTTKTAVAVRLESKRSICQNICQR